MSIWPKYYLPSPARPRNKYYAIEIIVKFLSISFPKKNGRETSTLKLQEITPLSTPVYITFPRLKESRETTN